jgi:hypothetical protein
MDNHPTKPAERVIDQQGAKVFRKEDNNVAAHIFY